VNCGAAQALAGAGADLSAQFFFESDGLATMEGFERLVEVRLFEPGDGCGCRVHRGLAPAACMAQVVEIGVLQPFVRGVDLGQVRRPY
jgi:hypothetical protein